MENKLKERPSARHRDILTDVRGREDSTEGKMMDNKCNIYIWYSSLKAIWTSKSKCFRRVYSEPLPGG